MRFLRRLLRFVASLLLDMLFHPIALGALIVLLLLHLFFGVSIWWFIGALIAWVLVLRIRARFLASASKAAAEHDVIKKKY